MGDQIRWEREGLPGGVRGRSHSVPSVLGLQYGVKSGPQVVVNPPHASELSEMREMLKLQQEQLNQLTQNISRLQNSHQRGRSPRRGPILCRRCQQPGHFARECEGVLAAPRTQLPYLHNKFSRQPHTTRHSGKLGPAELQSHSSGGAATGSEVVLSDSDEVVKLMSSFPHLDVSMGGVSVPCLVDTGSMVSTVTEFLPPAFRALGSRKASVLPLASAQSSQWAGHPLHRLLGA